MTQPKGGLSVAETLFLHGFTEEIVPVIPPNAPLTSRSKVTADILGKVPGRMLTSGEWVGGFYPVLDIQSAQRVDSWLGNIGIETTRIIPIDIDVNDDRLHGPIVAAARKAFGADTPVRMGKRPLLILRIKGPCSIGRKAVIFERKGVPGTHKIETFFGAHKQFVIYGTHPSGIPYVCDPPVSKLQFDNIPETTEKAVLLFFDNILTLLQDKFACKLVAAESNSATDRTDAPPPKEDLTGSITEIAALMRTVPNTKGRERWVGICHALKGATQHEPKAGRKIWLEWCEAREDGDPHLDEAKRVWASAGKTGLWIGMDALLSLTGQEDMLAQREFSNAPDIDVTTLPGIAPPSLFCIQPVHARPLIRPEWVIRNILPKGACLGVMYGLPGGNKSTLVTTLAVHIALGLPFAGNATKAGRVLLISEEDAVVNRRRLTAWEIWLGEHENELPLPEDWRNRLHTDILETYPGFGHISKKKVAHAKKELEALTGTVSAVFIDTLARTFIEGGEENEGSDMNKYIDLAEDFSDALSCPVIVLHHPPKGADTLRGHGSLLGAVGVVYKVERSADDNVVRMYCQKMREAAEFAPLAFNRHAVDISFHIARKDDEDNEAETALVLENTEWTEVANVPSIARAAGSDAGRNQSVTDMDILRQMVLEPEASGRSLAAMLGFSNNRGLRYRMQKLQGQDMVQQDEKGRWVVTKTGLHAFRTQHPEGVLS